MSDIVFEHIGKRYGDGFVAVKDMNLAIDDGEFMILVGPSGCGKSTALRMVAGLEDITDGELKIGGEVVNDRAPKDRDSVIARLRREPDDVGVILPYEEVVQALGFVSERPLGLQVVPLESIVGTVDRGRDFDRRFRPTSRRVRSRWENIAAAMRRGEALPPVDLLKVGELYFVRDGHHRVSVAAALGRTDIDAYVTEVVTRVDATATTDLTSLPVKSHERVFFERVPLPSEARPRTKLSDPWEYAMLAEGVEAWSFRAMQEQGELLEREETARMWFEEEYRPVVEAAREADVIDSDETETEAYMRIVSERYRLLRTHAWNDAVLQGVVDGIGQRRRHGLVPRRD